MISVRDLETRPRLDRHEQGATVAAAGSTLCTLRRLLNFFPHANGNAGRRQLPCRCGGTATGCCHIVVLCRPWICQDMGKFNQDSASHCRVAAEWARASSLTRDFQSTIGNANVSSVPSIASQFSDSKDGENKNSMEEIPSVDALSGGETRLVTMAL